MTAYYAKVIMNLFSHSVYNHVRRYYMSLNFILYITTVYISLLKCPQESSSHDAVKILSERLGEAWVD